MKESNNDSRNNSGKSQSADKPEKPKSAVTTSASSGQVQKLTSSTTIQAKSGMILVSASKPMVATVQPPPDERNTPMYGWLPIQEESLTVQDIDIDGNQYQVLKNTSGNEQKPQLLPDKEQIERNHSMDLILARLNSQLLDSSADFKRVSKRDKQMTSNQGSHQPRENSKSSKPVDTNSKSQSQSKSNLEKPVAQPKTNQPQKSNSASAKSKTNSIAKQ